MPVGQDWVDVLDARAAGLVPGFAAHGAPVETADVHPDERDGLDVQPFAGIERPSGDWRDVRIAELETQLGRMTGAPVDPRDARIAELTAAIGKAQAGQPAAPPTPPTMLPGSSYPPSAASSVPAGSSVPEGSSVPQGSSVTPPVVLEREPEAPVTAEEFADLEERYAEVARQLEEARAGAEPKPAAKKAPAKKSAAKRPTARTNV